MKRISILVLPIVAGLILSAGISRPAHAQFAGNDGYDQVQQFAPMLKMMRKKLGKKRFAKLMQTFGPMMSKMMDGQAGGFGGLPNGGFDMNAMSGMMDPQTIGSMVEAFGGENGFH